MAILWQDHDLQLFKEELDNMLEDERLMVSGGSAQRARMPI